MCKCKETISRALLPLLCAVLLLGPLVGSARAVSKIGRAHV